MPRNKDFKRLIRARIAMTGERYTTARALLIASRNDGSTLLPRRPQAPSGGLDPHPGVLKLSREQPPVWIWATMAAYLCARRGNGFFAGSYVLREAGTWLPGITMLRRYGIVVKDGESTRGGHRAWYRLPEAEKVAAALCSLGLNPSDFAWMTPRLRLFALRTGELRPKDIDTNLRMAMDAVEDDFEEITHLQSIRDDLWQRSFGQPAPSLNHPLRFA